MLFHALGSRANNEPVRRPYQTPALSNGCLLGTVTVLNPNFGNVGSNLLCPLVEAAGKMPGVRVRLRFL